MEPFWDARKFSAGQSTTQYAEILPESLLHLRPLSQPSNFTRTHRTLSVGRKVRDRGLATRILITFRKNEVAKVLRLPFLASSRDCSSIRLQLCILSRQGCYRCSRMSTLSWHIFRIADHQ